MARCHIVLSFLPKAGFFELKGLAPLPTISLLLDAVWVMRPSRLAELDLEVLLTNLLVRGAASINLKNDGKDRFLEI